MTLPPHDSPPPICVRGLRKFYGDFEAVRGIDFEVHTGEVFGLLGPNGAGKTTTVEILEGLRTRDGGEVAVLGLDPGQHSRKLKDRIGISLQSTNLPDKMRISEALRLFSSFYSRTRKGQELLERLQLTDKVETYWSQLSGGQRQRLVLALALLNDPQVIFLDEPTAGLDPQARHEIHTLIQQLRSESRTVLLTTHYIEEAERLCDRVAIIDEGKVIASGTPRAIQQQTLGSSLLEVTCATPLPAPLPDWPLADHQHLSEDGRHLTLSSEQPAPLLMEVLKWIDGVGIELSDVNLKRPSLEDVFIELTGRSLRE